MKNLVFAIILVFGTANTAVSATASSLNKAVEEDLPYLVELFKYFHANPELSLQEVKTSRRLAQELKLNGFKIQTQIGKTGIVGVMQNGPGPVLMIRADMDGLPVLEKTHLDYASKVIQKNLEGQEMPVMHACGHDMHITSLVGVAKRMAAMREQWSGTLILLGQPAEEALGGAKGMVADGLYSKIPRPDAALALHVIAKYPAGKIAFSDGHMYSSADSINIRVKGIATHGASPHLGIDPVIIGSQIVLALQTIITREISPIEPALITVGAFNSGTAPNVISDHADLKITVRANNEKTRHQLLASIKRVTLQIARAAGVPENMLPEIKVAEDGAPTTTNNSDLAKKVRKAISKGMGEDAMVGWYQSDMGAEDFPDLVNISPPIPSVYFEVGGTLPEILESKKWSDHHSPLFQIEPEISIKAGVEAMTLAALDILAK